MDNEFYIYDQIMMGNRRSFGKAFFEPSDSYKGGYNPVNEKRALKVIKYAIERYLGWDADYAYLHFDKQIVDLMKLNQIIQNHIRFPVELEPLENLQYIICRLYPLQYRYNSRESVERYYSKILSKEISRFKKNFFSDENGSLRAKICFRYMVNHFCRFTSYEEAYELFACTRGKQLLKHYGLFSASRDLFEFPLDFLHYSLPPKIRESNELLYYKLRFQLVNDKQKRKLRKEHKYVS